MCNVRPPLDRRDPPLALERRDPLAALERRDPPLAPDDILRLNAALRTAGACLCTRALARYTYASPEPGSYTLAQPFASLGPSWT
jgi:hypothetical protein